MPEAREMSRRLTVFTRVLDATMQRTSEEVDLASIQRSRRAHFPRGRLAQRIIGPIDRSVMVLGSHAVTRDAAEIGLRIYRPHGISAVAPGVLFLHGGGWVQGNVVNYDPLCMAIAAGAGAVVVSVNYRLAPEHKAPTAVHDAQDAAVWVLQHAADHGIDAKRLAVAGDSAGGNLAALVAQDFRDRGLSALKAQALIYPSTDLSLASPSIEEHAHAPVLTRTRIHGFVAHYLDGSGLAADDPLVSPLFGRLDALPPTLIQTAALDPIRDDGRRYADRLEAAGTPVTLSEYAGAPHGFASFPGVYVDGPRQRRELVQFLLTHLGRAHAPLTSGG